MANSDDVTVDEACRLVVIAVAADMEYWLRAASVDGQVGVNDVLQVLDRLREHAGVGSDQL